MGNAHHDLVAELTVATPPWAPPHQSWKIEVVTERVGDMWVCQQIRVTVHPKTARPIILTLAGSFASISEALEAGEEHARRWIDGLEGNTVVR